MLAEMKRSRSQECLGDLQLDQWRAGELATDNEALLKRHLADCERCRERQSLLEQARERYEATLAPVPEWLSGVSEPERRRSPFRKLVLGSLVALILAAGVLLVLPNRDPFLFKLPRFGALRKSGLPFVSLYVERGLQLQPVANAQLLQPGERVRFAYSAGSTKHLAILSLDSAGHASVYYPQPASRAARLPAGSDVLLPSAVTLDATLGEASVVAVFCEQGFELEPMRAALELEWSSLRAPAGCSTQEIHVSKRSKAP